MKKLIFVLMIFLCGVFILSAQTTQDSRQATFPYQATQNLSLDAPHISSYLEERGETWYSVTVNETGFLIVETTGGTDTYLEAYAAQGNLITENDDGGENRNARIEMMAISGSRYIFKLRGFGNYSSGPYTIGATLEPLPAMTELTLGMQHRGTLAPRGGYWYSFSNPMRVILSVQLSSEASNSSIEQYDENFVMVNSWYSSNFELFTMPNKKYFFRLRHYDDYPIEDYTITFIGQTLPQATELTLGTPHSGTIQSGGSNWYSVRSRIKGIISVYTTGHVDTYLYAFDSDYNPIREDDDSGTGQNALINLAVEPYQTYIFRLRTMEWADGGPYEIVAVNISPTELRAGVVQRGSLIAGGANWYSISTRERSFVTVQTTGFLDTYLEVYTPEFEWITYDDDSGDGVNAMVTIQSAANQTMYIRLKGYKEKAYGNYSISVDVETFPTDTARNTEKGRAIPFGLDANTDVFFHEENESRWFVIENNLRADVNISIFTEGDLDTMLVFYDNQGNQLYQDDDSGTSLNALINYRLNTNVYFVEVKTFAGRTGKTKFFIRTL